MKNGFIYGLLAGVLYMIWAIAGGSIFPNLVYAPIPSIVISSLIVIILMILACQKEKASLDGSIRFGEAFLTCLATYAAFNLVYGIGFKFYMDLSPTAMATFLEITKISTADWMTKMGSSEDEIFMAVEEFEKNIASVFTWKTTFLNIAGGTIFPGALLALIVAGVTSKFSKKQ